MKTSTLSLPLCVILTFLCLISGVARADLTDGLMAYYPLDGNADDLSGNGKHGTVFGATPGPGMLGQSFHFDGTDDYIRFPALSNGSKSISFWARTVGDSGYNRLLSYDGGYQQDLWSIQAPDGKLEAGGRETTAGDLPHLYGTSVITDNKWFFAALTLDSVANKARLYVDGKLEASSDQMSAALTMFDHDFYAMRDNFHVSRGSESYTPGAIDDIRIYNRALSAGEIKTLAAPDPKQQQRPDPIPDLVPTGKKNIVVITHGWNTSESDIQNEWIPFRESIVDHIQDRGESGDWDVRLIDWHDWNDKWNDGDLLGEKLPNAAYNHALTGVGPNLGADIADSGYEKVHFIAHSAGSAAISMASQYLEADTVVQTTFLDPYLPSGAREFYGDAADWADSYFSRDWTGFMTEGALPNAHNVDVTGLDPTIVMSHGWPVDWYRATVDGIDLPPGSGNYGFPLSLAGGGWNPSKYPVGNDPEVLGGGSSGTTDIVVRNDAVLNIASQVFAGSHTGVLDIIGTSFSMLTGSPVWMTTLVETNETVNFLTFEADFTSIMGAEGLLAVYWENELLGLIDERYAIDGIQEYTLFLTGDLEAGSYLLSFRLDPYTDIASSVLIDNVSTGYVAPEPASLSLLTLGAIAVLRKRRKQ